MAKSTMAICQPELSEILLGIPDGLRVPLIATFREIARNYRERRWEPSELNGGKLCEIAYAILRGHVDGQFAPTPLKPQNFLDACREFEKADSNRFPRSIRIQIPRILIALYEIRNNRGVGHVGAEVDANQMDAVVVLQISKWLLAELVRLFHKVDTETAQVTVDSIVDRTVPIVWKVGSSRRVLDESLTTIDQTLLLLYSCMGGALDTDLCNWVEGEMRYFRRDVLVQLHKRRFIEYDRIKGLAVLSPTGIAYVEEQLPLDV
jgi:hypothetical protein